MKDLLLSPKKIKVKVSRVYICEQKTQMCLGKFIKTRGRDQKMCLNCLKEIANPVPSITVRQVEQKYINITTIVG